MAWRVLMVENPAYLSLRDNKIVIRQEEEALIPLEDIDSIVLDNNGITFSQRLISTLAKHNIATIICDEQHLPNAILDSYSQASRGYKNARMQIEMSKTLKKQIWQKNIIAKISSQADVLKRHGLEYEDLVGLSKEVRSGDIDNKEAIAARLYFNRLLDDSTRRKPTWYNSALNYGYAVVRASIARNVAARGLIAMIGMEHHSELNQYNLVDDLIETFRPIVDDYIMSKTMGSTAEDDNLNREDRRAIVDILNKSCIIEGKKYGVKEATSIIVDSYMEAIKNDNPDFLKTPKIIFY